MDPATFELRICLATSHIQKSKRMLTAIPVERLLAPFATVHLTMHSLL